MKIEPLGLSHQTILEERFKKISVPFSEFSFANLYLFRNIHQYQVIEKFEEIFIQGKTRNGISFVMLTSDPSGLSHEQIQSICEEFKTLFPLPEPWIFPFAPFLNRTFFREEDCDYLFQTQKLMNYKGRNLSGKRNLVKQLQKHNQLEIKELSNELELKNAKYVLEKWKEGQENYIETDYLACKEALELFNDLHLLGRIIYADGKPAAFSIMEMITEDCLCVHFAKGIKSFKGIYQMLFQDVAQRWQEKVKWINLEEDLGIPSLRKAKHSYAPDLLLRKWFLKITLEKS